MQSLRCLAAVLAVLAAFRIQATFAQEGDATLEHGRDVFLSVEPACSICHVLQDAGAEGKIGPNLDELRPDADKVRNALIDGPGAMPAYGELLSKEEIDAIAAYVAQVAGQYGGDAQ